MCPSYLIKQHVTSSRPVTCGGEKIFMWHEMVLIFRQVWDQAHKQMLFIVFKCTFYNFL